VGEKGGLSSSKKRGRRHIFLLNVLGRGVPLVGPRSPL